MRASVFGRTLLLGIAGFVPVLLVAALAGCATSQAWVSLGPRSASAVILSLAADPAHVGAFYAGSSDGHVYRYRVRAGATSLREDSGDDISQGAAVDAVLPDGRVPETVYAGTSAGFYRSRDAGAHWTRRGSGLPTDDTIVALAFSSAVDTTIIAGTTAHGLYASDDGGATWRPLRNGLPADANIDALWRDLTSGALFAAADGVGVFTSRDHGHIWALIPTTAGLMSTQVFAFADLPTAGNALQAGGTPPEHMLYAGSARGLFVSVDSGRTWSQSGYGHGLPPGERILALAVDPTTAGGLYAGTDQQVFHSTDEGRHWALVAPGLAHPVAAVLPLRGSSDRVVVFAAAGDLMRYPAG